MPLRYCNDDTIKFYFHHPIQYISVDQHVYSYAELDAQIKE